MSDNPNQDNQRTVQHVQHVQQRFGATAVNYVNSPVHNAGYSLDRLIELVNPGPGKLALDIATGGGHVALAMAKRGAAVIASDITAPMLYAARANAEQQEGITRLNFGVANGQNLPFPDQYFDIVTTRLAPHHFSNVIQYVAECARVLKPGGLLGLVDHAGSPQAKVNKYVNAYERLRDSSHVWEYSQQEWEGMFLDAGLHIVSSEITPVRLNLPWWTRMQHNDAETVIRLRVMLQQAPQAVSEWLQPDLPEFGEASFTRWMVILVATKPT